MDFLLELLADIILDGSVEILTSMRMPVFLRVIAGLILGVVYGGLTVLGVELVVSGVMKQDTPLILVGALMVVIMVAFAVMFIRKLLHRS